VDLERQALSAYGNAPSRGKRLNDNDNAHARSLEKLKDGYAALNVQLLATGTDLVATARAQFETVSHKDDLLQIEAAIQGTDALQRARALAAGADLAALKEKLVLQAALTQATNNYGIVSGTLAIAAERIDIAQRPAARPKSKRLTSAPRSMPR
jgi:hypothetical protein